MVMLRQSIMKMALWVVISQREGTQKESQQSTDTVSNVNMDSPAKKMNKKTKLMSKQEASVISKYLYPELISK